VVLTDGRENEGVTIEEAKAVILDKTPAQRLFAVGFGLDQLTAGVASAASETGGVAFVTGDVVADKEFLLQKLFVQILSDEADWSMISDPVRRMGGGESGSTYVHVGETDLVADFIVAFRPGETFPKYLRTWLKMPDGAVINPDNLNQYPRAQYVERGAMCSTVCYYLPSAATHKRTSAVGRCGWRMTWRVPRRSSMP